MSNFFFISKNNIQKNNFQFDSDESHHLINVMRLNIGSEIYFTDGEGGSYTGSISSLDNEIVSGNILDVHNNKNELNYHIHLGLPVIKKSRIKIAIEKSVESGVKEITPLSLERSVKQNISIERLSAISKSAVKQSMRSIIPAINPTSCLSDWYDSDGNGETDNPWKPVYPWKDGDYIIIEPTRWYVDGDSWTADLSKLGQSQPVTKELLEKIHKNILIDEGVRLSKKFGADNSYKFINATLEKILESN